MNGLRFAMKTLAVVLLISSAATCLDRPSASAVPSQVTASNDTGVRPGQSYAGSHENINLSNGNLSVEIPLVSLPGRNGLNFTLALQYDSKNFQPHAGYGSLGSDLTYFWTAERRDPQVGDMGWRFSLPFLAQGAVVADSAGNKIGQTDSIFTDSDGGKHSFAGSRVTPGAYIVDSEDASFMTLDRFNASDVVVRRKDGLSVHFGSELMGFPSKIEDSNGNYISINTSSYPAMGITDTVGRQVNISYDSNGDASVTYRSSDGTLQTIKLHFDTLALFSTDSTSPYFTGARLPKSQDPQRLTWPFANPFQQENRCSHPDFCAGYIWTRQPGAGEPYKMLTSITLPNQTTYTFAYNGYGELIKVTYPTGGYTRYGYVAKTHHETFWEQGTFSIAADFREISDKWVCTSGGSSCAEDHTTYAATVGTNDVNNTAMTVTDPAGKVTYEFTQYSGRDDWQMKYHSAREKKRTVYASDGSTALKTVETTYTLFDMIGGTPIVADGDVNDYLPTAIKTTLYDGTSSLATTTTISYDTYDAYVYANTGLDFTMWTYGARPRAIDNPTSRTVVDYGSSTVLQAVNTTWANNTSAPALWGAHIWDKPLSVQVTDGATQFALTSYEYDHYTQAAPLSGTQIVTGAIQLDIVSGARGNVTKITRSRDATSAPVETRNQYDDAGNLRETTDPLAHRTTYDYTGQVQGAVTVDVSDPSGHLVCGGAARTSAFLTKVIDALGHSSERSYNACTGTVATERDVNGQATNYTYADAMDRVTHIRRPDSGVTDNAYADGPNSSVATTESVEGSATRLTTTYFDGLGRITQKTLEAGPGTDADRIVPKTFQETSYDGVGRVQCVTNWHTSASSPTDGQTCYAYDPLDRVTAVSQPDGSSTITRYTLNARTVTDEGGKARKLTNDALGRLVAVWEDPSGLNYETDYCYNPRNDLLAVAQKASDHTAATCAAPTSWPPEWRPRWFTYDSLSELITAHNPESGTIAYAYDDDGRVVSKTDARGITTSYDYDPDHRMTSKNFGNVEPGVTFAYDTGGCLGLSTCSNVHHRTHMDDATRLADGTYAAGGEDWVYDVMGRVTLDRRTTTGITASWKCSYNFQGAPSTITYPSEHIVTYRYNAAAQPLSAVDVGHAINYAQVAAYAPSGALASVQNGANLVSTFFYNKRQQPCRISVRASGSAPANCTDASATGNVLDLSYNFNLGAGDNGNVIGIGNNRNTVRSQNFEYDRLNRLTSAYTSGSLWGNDYIIDAWGNLTNMNRHPGKDDSQDLQAAPASVGNRLPGFDYDPAGNLTRNGTTAYAYDAESRVSSAAGVAYGYDGDGQRIRKSTGTIYWGEGPLAESDAAGNLTHEFVFFGGKRIARLDLPSGTVHYYFTDHLGSADVVTTPAGSIENESDYYPFGGERVVQQALSDQNYKFTGKERDSESGLDYFGARYYRSAMGRWMSPDWAATPEPTPYADLSDPQSVNMYGYVRNNPLVRTDADGHGGPTALLPFYYASSGSVTGELDRLQSALNAGSLIPGLYGRVAALLNAGISVVRGNKVDAAVNAAAVIPLGKLSKAEQLVKNVEQGAQAEKAVAKELVEEGREIVGSHVAVQTSDGLRVVDHVTTDAANGLTNVEVKSGNAVRSAAQEAKDAAIATEGGTYVGKNAPAEIRGQTLQVPTEVRKPKQPLE